MTKRAPVTADEAVPRISAERCAGRSRFASLLRAHIVEASLRGVTLVAAVGAQLGVSRQQVDRWTDATRHSAVIAAGDLDALDAETLLPVLERWIEAVRARVAPTEPARDPQLLAMTAAMRAGKIAHAVTEALADKRVDSREWAQIEAQLAEGEEELRQAKLAARAAKGAVR